MRAYVGQTRSSKLIARLAAHGIGEMTVREEMPPRRSPYALDNGAFRDWRAGKPFDSDAFERSVERVEVAPDFVVVPDVVAAGEQSLAFSVSWVPRLTGLAPLYLAVQDGMTLTMVAAELAPFAGLFVGGTLGWKIRTGEQWVHFAHLVDRRCHIGRVGTPRRVRWAKRIGADSIDSSLPLFAERNLAPFLEALGVEQQRDLFAS